VVVGSQFCIVLSWLACSLETELACIVMEVLVAQSPSGKDVGPDGLNHMYQDLLASYGILGVEVFNGLFPLNCESTIEQLIPP